MTNLPIVFILQKQGKKIERQFTTRSLAPFLFFGSIFGDSIRSFGFLFGFFLTGPWFLGPTGWSTGLALPFSMGSLLGPLARSDESSSRSRFYHMVQKRALVRIYQDCGSNHANQTWVLQHVVKDIWSGGINFKIVKLDYDAIHHVVVVEGRRNLPLELLQCQVWTDCNNPFASR